MEYNYVCRTIRKRKIFLIYTQEVCGLLLLSSPLTSMNKTQRLRLEFRATWRFCTKSLIPVFFPCTYPSVYKLYLQYSSKSMILHMVKGRGPSTSTKCGGVMFTTVFSFIIRIKGKKLELASSDPPK